MNSTAILARIADRGPRWHIAWQYRPDEHDDAYATSAAAAERIAERHRGPYRVLITPPVQYDDIRSEASRIGAEIREARRVLDDAVQRAAAVAVTAADGGDGIPETMLAAVLGVDRMTIRKWLGKR